MSRMAHADTEATAAERRHRHASAVLRIQDIDRTQVAAVGGKAAQLGELSHIDGINVPPGFCVTTAAFRRVMDGITSLAALLTQLSQLRSDDHDGIRTVSATIRATIADEVIPADLAAEIAGMLTAFGEHHAYAVRSSATAEDLPTASFAGQMDTYLNITGTTAILGHITRCWASLFSERAVTYRARSGIDHRTVAMAVVVQQMVPARAAGILFTADPATSNRRIACVEATFGLGEALVSGRANADRYAVKDGTIVSRSIGARNEPALTDAQVIRLVQLGRAIEAHFGSPQDIEWCRDGDDFEVVQSRPITTLFPIPTATDDHFRVYVSVGHQQMMTDPMKPLGISVWQLTAFVPMHEAGGRLFVDVTPRLASPQSRAAVLDTLGRGDPLIRHALETIIARGDVIPSLPDDAPAGPPPGPPPPPLATDPAIVSELVERSEASIATLKRDIHEKSGPELFDFILDDIRELKRVTFDPKSSRVIMAGMEAAWWLNDQVEAWLGEKRVADALTQGIADNVTSEMGLALLRLADVIRPQLPVVDFLHRHLDDDSFLEKLTAVPGGSEARDAIQSYLDRYGMRCAGEVDITRPRWSERPAALLPLILSNIRNLEAGAAERQVQQGKEEAQRAEHALLERLRALPDGAAKAGEAREMIDRLQTFTGYREYPKFSIVSRHFIYKQALLHEADRLVQAQVLQDREDIFYLTFAEVHDVVRTNRVDEHLISQRKAAFMSYRSITPPRVLTSDGEALNGAYRRDDVPDGALTGLAVSSGTVVGRARVVSDIADATLEPGDILVTAFTDPSWSPLFVSIAGLVTEVGGLMTHGAVIAREYGLPAVVGVQDATRLIRDGQHIRVHGTDGYVEILDQ